MLPGTGDSLKECQDAAHTLAAFCSALYAENSRLRQQKLNPPAGIEHTVIDLWKYVGLLIK